MKHAHCVVPIVEHAHFVIPAQAGIHRMRTVPNSGVDSRLRGNDGALFHARRAARSIVET